MTSAGKNQPVRLAMVRTSEPLRKRLHWPRTLEARMDLGVRELRVPSTFEEYLAFSQDCDYRVHYREGQLISFVEIDEKTNAIMGEASVNHEALVMRIGKLLSEILERESAFNFKILGSNIRLFIAEDRKGYNADVTVIKGEIEEKTFQFNKRKVTGVTNPWLVVEVLSASTREFDLSEKLNDYKQIPSLQQIIFIEQDLVRASTYIRVTQQEWRNLDFNSPEDQIPVLKEAVSLAQLFDKIL